MPVVGIYCKGRTRVYMTTYLHDYPHSAYMTTHTHDYRPMVPTFMLHTLCRRPYCVGFN